MFELPEDLISLQNVLVFGLSEGFGIPFCYAAAQQILDQKYVSGVVGFVVGIPLVLLGVSWPWLKMRATPAMIALMDRLVTPNRLLLVLAALFIYVAGPNFIARINIAQARLAPPPPVTRSATIAGKGAVTGSVRVQAPPPPPPDLRTVPLAPGSTLLPLVPHFDESVTVWCFPYDPDSCSIALQYRSRLNDGFKMHTWHVKDDGGNNFEFLVGMSHLRRTDFKGIKIATLSQDRPEGAKELLQNLRAVGVPADFNTDTQENLGPKDFEVWVGGRP